MSFKFTVLSNIILIFLLNSTAAYPGGKVPLSKDSVSHDPGPVLTVPLDGMDPVQPDSKLQDKGHNGSGDSPYPDPDPDHGPTLHFPHHGPVLTGLPEGMRGETAPQPISHLSQSHQPAFGYPNTHHTNPSLVAPASFHAPPPPHSDHFEPRVQIPRVSPIAAQMGLFRQFLIRSRNERIEGYDTLSGSA